MNLKQIFIGPLRYWLIWPAVLAVLYGFGATSFHVKSFVPFGFLMLGLSAVVVVFILATHRHGERVTREPLEGDEG
jgi:hypothetical protein